VAYHLAVVLDDALQGITHVIRGQDLFEAAHIQRLLQALLDLPTPTYRHHRLLVGPDGKRYAKRDKAQTLRELRAAGVTPASCGRRWASSVRSAARLLHQLAHGLQIGPEGLAARVGQAHAGQGLAADEALVDRHIAGVLQLAQVDRQVALGHLQQVLQLGEVRHLGAGQIGDDPQPHPAVNDVVQSADVELAGHARLRPPADRPGAWAWRIIPKPGNHHQANRPRLAISR
jgi:hypothetical protein